MKSENNQYRKWSKLLMEQFEKNCSPIFLNGHTTHRLPHNINISFFKVENKALIQEVNSKLAISTGSACTTLNVEPSHVILALGLGVERAHTAIRLGLGRFNTDEEIDFSANYIIKAVKRLRNIVKFS